MVVIDGGKEVENVLRHWRIVPYEATRPKSGTMNEVFMVAADVGRLVLRGHRKRDLRALEFEHAVTEAARVSGVPAPCAMLTPAGDRIVDHDGRWWSLLIWIDGEQPARGLHSLEQAASMGEMLARIHDVLEPIPPFSATLSELESTAEIVRRADALLSLIEHVPDPTDDETAAARWLGAQRDWLRSRVEHVPPDRGPTQTIHGDYHDANIVFRDDAVAGVLDWDKADIGRPTEELIRALHLSFRLEPERCCAFIDGYRSRRAVTTDDLDGAARSYGFQRDRSIWLFDELYRGGNERLRPLLNHDPFVPFEASWQAVRAHL